MLKLLVLSLAVVAYQSVDCIECIEEYNPELTGVQAQVCAEDGVTYLNECFAKCNDSKVAFEGRCPHNQCLDYYYPVCGANGQTWANSCEANYYG